MPLINDRAIDSVVIAGAGGFGMEVFDYLSADARGGGPTISGFIDDGADNPIPAQLGSTHLGAIGDYRPVEREAVVVAVGSVKGRRLILSRLWEMGCTLPVRVGQHGDLSECAVRRWCTGVSLQRDQPQCGAGPGSGGERALQCGPRCPCRGVQHPFSLRCAQWRCVDRRRLLPGHPRDDLSQDPFGSRVHCRQPYRCARKCR